MNCPRVLKALQYIFVTSGLNEKVFSLLEKKIIADKKKTGRPGMGPVATEITYYFYLKK